MKKNLAKAINHIELAKGVNSVIYFLSNAPVLKKFFHADLVKEYTAKEGVVLTFATLRFLFGIAKKAAYVMLIATALHSNNMIRQFGFYFLLLTVVGSINKTITNFDMNDYDNVILLRVSPEDYGPYIMRKYIQESVARFLPAMLILTGMYGVNYLELVLYLLTYLAIHFIGEIMHMQAYARNNNSTTLPKKTLWICSLSATGLLIGIFAMGYFKVQVPQIAVIITCLPIIAAGAYSLYLLLYRTEYNLIFRYNLTIEKINDSEMVVQGGRGASVNLEDMSRKMDTTAADMNKTGYDFLFDTFLKRYHKTVNKGSLILILAIVVAGVLGIAVPFFIPEEITTRPRIAEGLFSLLSVLFYIIYFIAARSKSFMLSCFLQIDRYLINYSFFRKRQSISKNYLLRLGKIIELSIFPSALIAVFLCIIYAVHTDNFMISRLLVLLLMPISLCIFYSVYNISAYYLFQPYSENGEIVNKAYSLLDAVIYALTYIMMEAHVTFTITVLAVAMVIFLIISAGLYIAVMKVAPKGFRVR